MTWTKVGSEGMGDPGNNRGVAFMTEFDNKLVIGTNTLKGMFGLSSSYATGGVEVWASTNSSATAFAQINTDGFGTFAAVLDYNALQSLVFTETMQRELLARVDAVLRRSSERPAAASEYSFRGGVADFVRHEVRFDDGSSEALSERECELLHYLVQQDGRPVSREELLRSVWGLDPKRLETRTVDMHVAHLRQKLRDAGQTVVVTVRGQGYRVGAGETRDEGRISKEAG